MAAKGVGSQVAKTGQDPISIGGVLVMENFASTRTFENEGVTPQETVSPLHIEWMGTAPVRAEQEPPVAEPQSEKDPLKPVQESKEQDEKLEFDYVPQGRRMILVSITLPDGGKISRTTEPLPGRDGGADGFRILKGYTLPNGVLMPKEIHRNTDGSITIFDVDVENRNSDRHPMRLSQKEFIQFIKNYKE